MGLVGKRAEIAMALSGVDGVTGYEYRPTTPVPGDAWPLWSGDERDAATAFMTTWRVLVFMPQDERLASDWIDAHLQGLFDVLEPVAYVERLAPVTLPAAGGEQYAVEITMRSE
jgi:hypothetical protein